MHDTIIIGSGPAGISAAIYTARRAMKTLVLSKSFGGQVVITNEIENYPGFDFVTGMDLMMKMKEQAEKVDVEFKSAEIVDIIKNEDNGFTLTSAGGDHYQAKSVIMAFGLTPRDLGVPGEQEFKGKGVTYCATCDGPLFKGKTVLVSGGGNSALEAAEYLSKICSKVYLVHRRDQFRGEQILIDRVLGLDNVEVVWNSHVTEIFGENVVKGVKVNNTKKEQLSDIAVDGVFIKIGFIAQTGFIKDLVNLDEMKQILVDKDGRTSLPGIFAAGDITDTSYKQIVISAGEGAKAALTAYKYLQEASGQKFVSIDWGLVKKDKQAAK